MFSSVHAVLPTVSPAAMNGAKPNRQLSDASSDSGDTFEKSAFSSLFEQLGLNSSSRLEATRERVDFNFSFTSSAKESLTASGFIAQREQHASLTLTYMFQRAVVVDGKRELKTFQASLLLEADTSQSLSVKPFKEK